MNESDRSIPPECRGLRDGVEAPDLSGVILQEVDRRKGWLSRRQRLALCVARWGAASVLLGVLAGVLLVERYTPVDEIVAPEPRPLADLMQNVRDETSVAVRSVSTQVRSLPQQLMSQSRQMVLARMERHGKTRVIELAGPAVIVDETTMMGTGYMGRPAPLGAMLLQGPEGRYWTTGAGMSWPASMSVPVGPRVPQSPLLPTVERERDQ